VLTSHQGPTEAKIEAMARFGDDGIGSHLSRLRSEVGSRMYRLDEGVPTRASHGTVYSVQIRLLLPKRPARKLQDNRRKSH
jgi:hypothetical protein